MTFVPSLTRSRTLWRTRAVSGKVILGVIALHTALLLGFTLPEFHRYISTPLTEQTNGFATHVLVTNALEFAVLIAVIMVVAGGLRLGDVGVRRRGLLTALLATLVLWGVTQLVMSSLAHLAPGPVQLNPDWMYPMVTYSIGRPLPGLFMAAFVEEVMYRGFLLPQLYHSAARWGMRTPGRRLLFALVVSQTLFGINHIPAGLVTGLTPGQITGYVLMATGVGVFFSVLYLRTDNLWLVIGLHAVLNQPLSFYLSPVDPSLVVLILGLLLTLAIPFLRRQATAPRPATPPPP